VPVQGVHLTLPEDNLVNKNNYCGDLIFFCLNLYGLCPVTSFLSQLPSVTVNRFRRLVKAGLHWSFWMIIADGSSRVNLMNEPNSI
jgi:hypothetical protein